MAFEIKDKEGLLAVGTTLANGKYRIDQYLSSGGFGNTYVATDTAFDEKVAIKELYIKGVCGRQENSKDISISLSENQRTFAAQQEKFRKEAKRLRKLSNAHIVKVHDLFDENGTSYYVMDFVEGESLSRRLKRTQVPIKEPELMLMIPQILDALECVHNEKIWHLDLKPANIMIDTKGNIQLIDFGASKQLRSADGNSLSTSSAMAYTPGFASSEQMEQNFEKFGPWTDLYSLGATIYNLLSLQQPPSPSDIEEDPDEALHLPDDISKKTHDLILWLMKPNRKMRPQSVEDVRQFLVETSTKGSGSKKEVKPDKPNVKKTPVSGDDTVVIGGSIPNGSGTEEPEEPPTSTKKIWLGVISIVAVIIILAAFYNHSGASEDVNDGNVVDTVSSATLTWSHEVTDSNITIDYGPISMRNYIYTGTVSDTLNRPEGKGVANFAAYGETPASTYNGNFVNGLCNDETGEATLTFTSGDKYIGTFIDGYYGHGKFILSDKSYFEGDFKNGYPYNGDWYNADGTHSAQVSNGEELAQMKTSLAVRGSTNKGNNQKNVMTSTPKFAEMETSVETRAHHDIHVEKEE